MLSSRVPNVSETYFQHKVLTKISGQPTYETLLVLSNEVRANAASVPSTLGGGLYGHLGLTMSDIRYATLANSAPWITPGHPGVFAPPAGATGPQIEAAKDVWRELKFTFDLCQATERALIAQVVDSVDAIYLRPLLNRVTGQYSTALRPVFVHLFETHGKVTPQQVKAKEQAICSMSYDLSVPIDTVFTTVDDLADLSEHSGSLMTDRQKMDVAFVVLAKIPLLQHDLRLWNRCADVDRTWPNMLTHFRSAQADLTALPTAGDMFHQANGVMMTTVADLVTQRLLEAYPPPPDEPAPALPAPELAAAAVQTREASVAAREAALLTQMSEMMALMRSPAPPHNQRNARSNRGRTPHTNARSNDRSRAPNGTPRGRAPPPTRLYCWSHGACGHTGNVCHTQQPGHQPTATFTNMMGGSTANCFWLPPAANA